jgi:hypothetical protein
VLPGGLQRWSAVCWLRRDEAHNVVQRKILCFDAPAPLRKALESHFVRSTRLEPLGPILPWLLAVKLPGAQHANLQVGSGPLLAATCAVGRWLWRQLFPGPPAPELTQADDCLVEPLPLLQPGPEVPRALEEVLKQPVACLQ